MVLSAHNVHAGSKLKTKEPELCYQCHEKLKENLENKYTHFLFKEGKCSKCHDPHVSNHEGLMRDEINPLCLDCHKKLGKLVKEANMHSALRKGVCTDCHYAHSGMNKHLLTKARNELCWDCHEGLKEKLGEPVAHPLFEKGECSSCHNSHASKEANLLLAAPNKTCKKCHGPRCSIGEVSISFATKDMDCTSCHTGHTANDKGLLGPFSHSFFLNRNCEECHNPFLEKKQITTNKEGKNICFRCHIKDSPIKYIDDDVHVKDAQNPCMVCHDPHASEKANLTKNESALCLDCHENTEKRTGHMERIYKVKCTPVTDRKCFECHMVGCSSEQPLYFTGDTTAMCVKCHAVEHKISHPLGPEAIDPRNNQPITCTSCHSLHSAKAGFMLTHDRKRALCIQCHKM
jgi:predicted CXXCH cytochrome family protein